MHDPVHHCSTPVSEPALLQVATETGDGPAEQPEVTDAELDSDKQLIYQ